MSYWTNISGVIDVTPVSGFTPRQERYVLETVLEHLPVVSGSESDMTAHVVRKTGLSHDTDFDELGYWVNNRPNKSYERGGWLILVDGRLRDRTFDETKREFVKWLFRLARNVIVCGILARVYEGHSTRGRTIVFDDEKPLDLVSNSEPIPLADYIPKWTNPYTPAEEEEQADCERVNGDET